MVGVYEILRQDFAAASAAFDDTDYHDMNICANRLMANVIFGDEHDAKYLVPGFFLRIIASDFLALKDDVVAKTVRQQAERFVKEIDLAFNEELDLKIIWNGFFEYMERKRELLMSPAERRAYKSNKAFTARGLSYLSSKFFSNPFLSGPDAILLRAFIIEADRLIRNHGAEQKELVLFSLIKSLDWLDRYVAVAFSDAEKSGNIEGLKIDVDPYIKRIQIWYSGSESHPYPDATGILCDILLKWRKYYLRYLERSKLSPDEERRVELPGQVRERIGETIVQALQKDVGEKGLKRKKG